MLSHIEIIKLNIICLVVSKIYMYYKQIYGRKQISIRGNRIEHLVHPRCAGIRLAQYIDTWIFFLHRGSSLANHTDITPPHPSRPWSNPLPTPHLHHVHYRNPNTDTRSTFPMFPQNWLSPKPNPLIHSPPHLIHRPRQTHTHFTHYTNSSHPTHHTHP